MQWFEMIKVLGADENCNRLAEGFCRQLDEESVIWREWGLAGCQALRDANHLGDLMLSLHWREVPPRPLGSDLGQAMARELKRYAIVDHTVWTMGLSPAPAMAPLINEDDEPRLDEQEAM